MLTSCIKNENRVPVLCIEGHPAPAMAYTTYFEERSLCGDFARAGYRLFFVNASFTTLPINSFTGFSPFRVGVFENPNMPNYTEFEGAVENILRQCPDAVILPRIHISMPSWWIEENPAECIPTPLGGKRESLFSEKFRQDGVDMLRRFVRHVKNAPYADRVAGWQLCGGSTQEWFHHDLNGGLPAAAEPYRRFVYEQYGEKDAPVPSAEEFLYRGEARQLSENAARYTLFSGLAVAKTLECFAKAVKEETEGKQIVGAFYGYSFENNGTVLLGTHALRALLDSPYLDFFSSPNAYTDNRAFGIDWADMLPVESLKLHGKLCFMECDIRTYLTTGMQEARPGEYPDGIYKTENGTSVWAGPPTQALSCQALRKCFAHQVARASGIWWFDMWGGWYDDPCLMTELGNMYKTVKEKNAGASLAAELIFFADESAYANLLSHSPQLAGVYATRKAMGNIGVPYDTYMVEDAATVLHRYRAAVFPFPISSWAGERAIALCREQGIPCLCADADHAALSVEEIRAFLRDAGIHLYAEEGDVVYVGQGYLGFHSATGGKKSLHLPGRFSVTPVFGVDLLPQTTDTLCFEIGKYETALLRLKDDEGELV